MILIDKSIEIDLNQFTYVLKPILPCFNLKTHENVELDEH